MGGAGPARNSLRGIVTKVTRDTVMAQVELVPGQDVWASVKATEVHADASAG